MKPHGQIQKIYCIFSNVAQQPCNTLRLDKQNASRSPTAVRELDELITINKKHNFPCEKKKSRIISLKMGEGAGD